MFGIMLAVLAVSSAVPSYAQDPQKEKEALYAKYIANYDKDIAKRKIAVEAGKEYLQKFGSGSEAEDPLIPYFKENVPLLEKNIKEAQDAAAGAAADKKKAEEAAARADKFNTSVKAKNLPQVFTVGQEIVDSKPDYLLDVYIVLASIGYDQAVANDNTYNTQAIDYAKKAIKSIESGEKSENYGINFGGDQFYQYKNKLFPDGKENALGWLNYNIGFIMYYNQKKQKEALPYLYEATKHKSLPQQSSDIFNMIGRYYYDEVARLEKERQALRTSLGNKDNEETLKLFALEKGFADRGADAYARAYNLEAAKATPDEATKKRYMDTFKQLYTFRNNGKPEGSDEYLAMVKSKELPNPANPVQPIVDEADKEIPVTDGTTTPATTDSTMTKPSTTMTKPSTTMTKPTTTTPAVKPATTTPATKPAAAVKPAMTTPAAKATDDKMKKTAPKMTKP